MTELTILALYAEAVSYPYMESIHDTSAGQQNMLDLGPLHTHVHEHMTNIIEDPNILVGTNSSHLTGNLHGKEWRNPMVVERILETYTAEPHCLDLLLAFFTGAAHTWERFTSEFVPGGLIDEATREQKDLAWMPPTNDENEGALGSFCLFMRKQPQLALVTHNSIAMFFWNNTQAFMAAKFTEDKDFHYLHKLAREMNSQERERRKKIVEFRDKKQAEKIACREARQKNAAAALERRADLELSFDKENLPNLKGTMLHDQYQLFVDNGAPNLQKPFRKPAKVAEIWEALSQSIDLYLAGDWRLPDRNLNREDENDSENFENTMDEEENDDDWDDYDDS